MLKEIIIKAASKNESHEYFPTSLNIFVGPNNSGKSLLLRELYQDLSEYYSDSDSDSLLLDGLILGELDQSTKDSLLQKNNERKLSSYENYLYFFDPKGNHVNTLPMQLFEEFSEGKPADWKS